MKVVLFCGGLGLRLREHAESLPKPMVTIGPRPIIWHVMKYYAHYGHKDFILCLGYRSDTIKNYFLNYDECVSNNFVLSHGGRKLQLLNSDIHDWNITFVDTGMNANIGMRLKAVQPYVEKEEMFLANYSDGLSDLPLPDVVQFFREQPEAVACFTGVAPTSSFHLVTVGNSGVVQSIRHVKDCGMRINGGYFVLRPEIFEWMKPGEELVQEPFQRLAAAGKLLSYSYDGFWACMDTFKEKQDLDDVFSSGDAPWAVWNNRKSHNGNGHESVSLSAAGMRLRS